MRRAQPRPRRRAAPAAPWLCVLSLALALASAPLASADSRSLERRASTVPGVVDAGDYLCRVEGDCQPCSPGDADSPVCKVYGNRRPLLCIPKVASNHPPSDSSRADTASSPPAPPHLYPVDADFGAARADEDNLLADDFVPGERPVDDDEALDGVDAAPDEPLSPAEAELREALEHDRRRQKRGLDAAAWDAALLRRRWDEAVAAAVERRQGGIVQRIQTYEACPKVLRQEYHDYFEFIMCNLAFAAVAGSILVYRQRTLALRQFGRLAARIMQTEMT
ncbi:hypothetical protein Rhopal_004363-T1 [Rhodotorula paludigena]|uniref:Uncharacterized protein n=1 Tax=Rhodotorula paludigena TaxID=86838 RepID=A0AAV5GQP6_9BASI|nr:hypothetical protein Rhopal_004363-T1 [Rhodotorula paludigena]